MSEKILKKIKEGEILVSDGGESLTCQVVGGIVVCVYDSVAQRGGILLLQGEDGSRPSSSDSVKSVLRKFKEAGSDRKNIEVKLILGVESHPSTQKHREAALDVIQLFGLKIAKEAPAGQLAKEIKFNLATGEILFREKNVETPGVSHRANLQERKALPTVSKVTVPKPTESKKPLRVLIVDDSKVIQKMISAVLSGDPGFTVVATANHPGEADEILSRLQVDVMTLDMKMPVMDGIAYLAKLMPVRPMPVVMISGAATQDSELALKALELGAVDFLEKPAADQLGVFALELKEKLVAASQARIAYSKIKDGGENASRVQGISANPLIDSSRMIVLGASTGGTVALSSLLPALPTNIPPVLIVQHIPAGFSKQFANRLNTLCPFTVKEAEDGDTIQPGKVLIAPGGFQMYVKKQADGSAHVVIKDDPPVNRHCPAVDVLFNSVADQYGPEVLGVLLTGMGKDGAQGLLKLKSKGCYTLAQDEESSAVFGMPREAILIGGAVAVVGLTQIAETLVKELSSRTKVRKAS